MSFMPTTPLAKLLIVDDEAAQMKALCNTLEDEGYATTGFTFAKDALSELRSEARPGPKPSAVASTWKPKLSGSVTPRSDGLGLEST